MTYKVLLTREARDDLQRLEEFLERAAMESGDFDLPLRAVDAILTEFGVLERNPFTCRRVSEDPFERELVIPFGKAGYVALFRVLSEEEVVVLAVRHQREDDYR
ncbi:type II toxin-antitoxin system RelE/ParE family toxin [Ramlibacter sp.]|uniref:type II toxin-antitoxin system RelE/ParE family toxin n=1 Tax=Ramlibacter sp. TaxID=1917967 RepID=UPI0026071C72|nr:type II toxin-antitoxin system RelE/ParE family toxin [Ramlibacter sp.]MDB5954108.1 putative plasmid stabilization system protein [Ramlibacter sp.]